MPLGDPGGGNFEYTTEGLPQGIFMASIPCKDLGRSISFYTESLGMELLYRTADTAVIYRGDTRIMLRISGEVCIDTGIYFSVDDPYALHRRLIDEGIIFVKDPVREPLGVVTSFRDCDGNIIYAMEMGAEFRPF